MVQVMNQPRQSVFGTHLKGCGLAQNITKAAIFGGVFEIGMAQLLKLMPSFAVGTRFDGEERTNGNANEAAVAEVLGIPVDLDRLALLAG